MVSPLSQESPLLLNAQARRSRRIAPILILLSALAIWFGYLWFVSGVIVSEEKYPGGAIKARGYAKRISLTEYKRQGTWTTFHPDGKTESQGSYDRGEKIGKWIYWDNQGKITSEEHYTRMPTSASG